MGEPLFLGAGTGASTRRLHRQQAEMAFPPGAVGQTRPISDPLLQGASSYHSYYHTARIVFGTITDSTAIANCYRVQLEKLRAPLPCYLATQTSLSAFGARQLNTLQPGTVVIVMVHEHLTMGAILGVMPPPGTAAPSMLPDQISQASRGRSDNAHRWPLQLPDTGLISDMLAGRPFDATTVGEAGWITETGLRIFIDPFMLAAAVDETCGLWAFYHDQLLRLAAYNLQFWTAGYEREGLDDQGEYNDYEGWTPYPWEQRGLYAPGDAHRENSATAWQLKSQHYAAWEPLEDHIQPWHRRQIFRGYLGQGEKSIVITAPVASARINTYAGGPVTQLPWVGLFDSNLGIDGRYYVRSAKGISFAKQIGICEPRKLRRPEQPGTLGDSQQNYKFAGVAGNGPEHTITGAPLATAEIPELQRASGILDLHAYLFNYSGVHPFFWHAKDWAVPQESELPHTGGHSVLMPQFSRLNSSMYLGAPAPLQVNVDHRYGKQPYYQNSCGWDLMEDGGVVFYDGFGSELLMHAGSFKITAPGDIWLKSGRNTIQWAGADLIMRAKNSADLTVTNKDVRITTGQNIQILSGNSGKGGILLESRAASKSYKFEGKVGEDVESSGIMLRAAKSEVVTWAAGIYARTGGGDVQGGPIVLDADKGKQPIVTHSNTFQNYVATTIVQWFGTEGKVKAANAFTQKSAEICGQLAVGSDMLVAGGLITKKTIEVTSGHIATSKAKAASGFVGNLEGQSLSKAQTAISDAESIIKNTLPEQGNTFYSAILQAQFYSSNRPGNDKVIQNAQVSLRNSEQYKTDNFKITEDRWQQLSRLSGVSLNQWTEKPVVCRADPQTYPYPGKTAFIGQTLLRQSLNLFDAVNGRSKDRGAAGSLNGLYANPEYGTVTPVKLDGNYTTIR